MQLHFLPNICLILDKFTCYRCYFHLQISSREEVFLDLSLPLTDQSPLNPTSSNSTAGLVRRHPDIDSSLILSSAIINRRSEEWDGVSVSCSSLPSSVSQTISDSRNSDIIPTSDLNDNPMHSQDDGASIKGPFSALINPDELSDNVSLVSSSLSLPTANTNASSLTASSITKQRHITSRDHLDSRKGTFSMFFAL
ncbi:unnamed protein product [Protopolystoma xenopodis]|uniref:Uncharacterized protein n=1 Tax=Protopolystoma xenopodis TaxID=117903 RepID=A0A448WU15_9PLAT|nr:unnamed protein product [Protopolystoma xenopodis]